MVASLILAGGKLAPELAAVADGVTNRALIRVGASGETMLDLVAQAVRGGSGGGRVLVAGAVPTPDGCEPVAGGDSFVETLMNGVRALRPDETRLLIVTADAPFLTADAVRDFLRRAESVEPAPFVYPLVDAHACAEAFPGMKRTALRIAEGTFTGGNIALVDPQFLVESADTIRAAYQKRKNVVALARILGGEIIARWFFSRVFAPLLAIEHVERALAKMLECARPRAIITPYVGIGADVDRATDVTIARQYFQDAALLLKNNLTNADSARIIR